MFIYRKIVVPLHFHWYSNKEDENLTFFTPQGVPTDIPQ